MMMIMMIMKILMWWWWGNGDDDDDVGGDDDANDVMMMGVMVMMMLMIKMVVMMIIFHGSAGIKQHQLHPERISSGAAHPAVFTHPESEEHRTSNSRATITRTRLLTTCLNVCIVV